MALLKAKHPILSTDGVRSRPWGNANPLADERSAAERGANRYGVCSIEDYPSGIGDLTYTHEDAGGFYNYVKQFVPPNFWYRDGNVLSWIYGEQYDDWQGTYGFDACTAEYHSGHGTMDANGVFSMPMGGTWGGTSWVSSNDMRLGNEVARYLFFSTCLSLRVLDGHTPIRTWDAANLGLRMIFGFETTSVDSPRYGEYFFNKWNANGHKFSKAWLDASWDIDHGQAPSAVGCGSTQAEAQDRVFNEGLFSTGAVAKNWWWWTWYNAARSLRGPELALPDTLRAARFGAPDFSTARLTALAEQYGVAAYGESLQLPPSAAGVRFGGAAGPTMSIDHRGVREVEFADPEEGDGLSLDEVVRIGQQAVESFGLAADVDLIVDKVRDQYHAGASRDESVAPLVRETHVVFTQMVDGLPVVTPGLGEVRVGVDGTGRVTAIADATLPVADVSTSPLAPPEPGTYRGASASTVDELLDAPVQRLLRRLSAGGRVPTEVRTVDGSTAVGWDARGGAGSLVARRVVEVDCGAGLAKRFVVQTPVG